MEFDKNKVLTVVTADQAKVGSVGHFSNYIPTLEGYVTRGCKPDKLVRVSLNTIYPFSDGHNYYSLFYPAPEPTYAERQAQWVKENNIKVGTKVRVTRTFTEDEDGSSCCTHNDLVGKTGVVIRNGIDSRSLGVDMNDGSFRAVPYFALEVIKEPTYRPYSNDELNDLVGKVVKHKRYEYNYVVTERATENLVRIRSILFSASELLELFTLNGEPCGVKEI